MIDDKADCRLFESEKQRIDNVVQKICDHAGELKYRNRSHFMRCAVIRLLREEEGDIK